MANNLGMTQEQLQRFFTPIIQFIQENPHILNLDQKKSESNNGETEERKNEDRTYPNNTAE